MKLDFDAELKLDFNSGERINLELIRSDVNSDFAWRNRLITTRRKNR